MSDFTKPCSDSFGPAEAFWGCLRFGNLVQKHDLAKAVCLADIVVEQSALILTIHFSKTTRLAERVEVIHLPVRDIRFCPLRAFCRWISL